jgi:hypothetical protein
MSGGPSEPYLVHKLSAKSKRGPTLALEVRFDKIAGHSIGCCGRFVLRSGFAENTHTGRQGCKEW